MAKRERLRYTGYGGKEWFNAGWFTSEHLRVRAEVVGAKRQALVEQGLAYEQADTISLDPAIYNPLDFGVERNDYPKLKSPGLPNIDIAAAYTMRRLIYIGESDGKQAARDADGDPPFSLDEAAIRAHFDRIVATASTPAGEDGPGTAFSNDKQVAYLFWSYGFARGWRDGARERQQIERERNRAFAGEGIR